MQNMRIIYYCSEQHGKDETGAQVNTYAICAPYTARPQTAFIEDLDQHYTLKHRHPTNTHNRMGDGFNTQQI